MDTAETSEPKAKRVALTLLSLAALGWGLFWRTYYFPEPFIDLHLGAGGSHIATFVRNLFRFGWETKLAPVENQGHATVEGFRYALNHLPLTHLYYAPAWAAFPGKEWALRATALLFTIASWTMIAILARRALGSGFAWLTLSIGAILPMGTYYDVHVDPQGPDVLAVSLALLVAYLAWLKKPSPRRWVVVLAVFAWGAATEWPIYYMTGAIILDLLIFRQGSRPFVRAASLIGCSFLYFLGFVAYVGWVKGDGSTGSGFEILAHGASSRSTFSLPEALARLRESGAEDQATAFFLRQVSLTTDKLLILLSVGAIVLTLLAFVLALWRLIRRQVSFADRVFLMLFAFGMAHVILFIPGALNHDYWWKYAFPAVAWGSALSLLWLKDLPNRLAPRWSLAPKVGLAIMVAGLAWLVIPTVRQTPKLFATTFEAPYERGVIIRERTAFEDVVLASDFIAFPELNYYSDRDIVPRVNNVAAFRDAIELYGERATLFTFQSAPPNAELELLQKILEDRYAKIEIEGRLHGDGEEPSRYLFFDLREKK